MTDRRFDPSPLTVNPGLAGCALPSPRRRVAAFAADSLLLLLPTLATALAFAALALYATDPAGFRAVRTALVAYPEDPEAQHALLRDLVPVLARVDAEGLPAATRAAIEEGTLDLAADQLATLRLLVTLQLGGQAKLPADTVRLPVERLIPASIRTAALFFVPAVYFAVATSLWGTTLGKRWLGLRVLRLDGRKLSLLESVERFGAYFGILGTLGLGLFDLWRDPNRRLGHDRAADTVVVRRAASRASDPPIV